MTNSPFRVTIIHPCVGRYVGMKKYIRTWKMEPLSAAMVAALLPKDVERRFYDDRLEAIPFDEPTDLVTISVETYTARRAYQIASEYRRRGIPVLMGGFHATLCPQEVLQHCEAIVIGEAESVLPQVIDDFATVKTQSCIVRLSDPHYGHVPIAACFKVRSTFPSALSNSLAVAGSSATSARSSRSSARLTIIGRLTM